MERDEVYDCVICAYNLVLLYDNKFDIIQRKKGEKSPRRELEQAKRNLKNWIERVNEDGNMENC